MEKKKNNLVAENVAEINDLSQHPAVVKVREEHFKKAAVESPFTIAVAGDIIQSNPIAQRQNSEIRGILDIVKRSDIAVANMESNFADYRNQSAYVGGLEGMKEVAQDVKDMGFDLVARASNHSTDMGISEMFRSNKLLQEAGVVYAGTGINLEDARAPQYFETPKGRVGMVAMCMSYSRCNNGSSSSACAGMEMASYQAGNMGGLPGINCLRVRPYLTISKEKFAYLKEIKAEQQEFFEESIIKAAEFNTAGRGEFGEATHRRTQGKDVVTDDQIFLFGNWFKVGEHSCGQGYKMNPDDLRLNMRSIRDGKEWSDFMIATVHSHDYDNIFPILNFLQQPPSDYLIEIAHMSIDNGADMFVGTGPHILRGIEIYKGRPIFYSLASFIYQLWGTPAGPDRYTDNRLDWYYNETTNTEMNMEAWPPLSITKHADTSNMESMESAVAECKYEDGKCVEIHMHPIEFGYDAPISQRGIPRVPKPDVALRILKRLQRLSEPFGTVISIENNIGVIRL